MVKSYTFHVGALTYFENLPDKIDHCTFLYSLFIMAEDGVDIA